MFYKNRNHPQRNGTIIVLVLVIIAILTLAALTFSGLMLAERRGADYSVRRTQVRLFAESGIEAVRMALLLDEEDLEEFGYFYDNYDQFCGVLVTDSLEDPRDVGRFSVIAPFWDEDGLFYDIRYGLWDESSKLSLRLIYEYEQLQPGVGREILMHLPGMEQEIADAILDWIDEDDETRDYGYEADYYESLDISYLPRNGMVESLEELLLIEGVTPLLLFGADWNRNHLIDIGEPNTDSLGDYDNSDRLLDGGWASLLTIDSREKSTTATGTERVYVNADDLESLQTDLNSALNNEEWVKYILAYRLFGTTGTLAELEDSDESDDSETPQTPPQTGQSSESQTPSTPQGPSGDTGQSQNQQENSEELDLSQTPVARVNSPFDLIGGSLQVRYSGQTETTTLQSPFSEDVDSMAQYLPTLIEALMFSEDPRNTRINITEASRGVLLAIPGMTDNALNTILENRLPDPSDAEETEEMATYAWPLLLDLIDLETMKAIGPYLSQEGAVKSAQIVARFDSRSPVVRLNVLFDLSEQPAKIAKITDLTDLGPGYTQDLLGVYEDSASMFSTGTAVTENRRNH